MSRHAPTRDRFDAAYTVSESGCWEWNKPGVNGYGEISHEAKRWLAHRLMWTWVNGPIPDGMYVCHRCDNPRCVNPDHLFLGTSRDNMRDAVSKGRLTPWSSTKTHCKRGHPLAGDNLHIDASGGRQCVTCRRLRWNLYDRGKTVRTAGLM